MNSSVEEGRIHSTGGGGSRRIREGFKVGKDMQPGPGRGSRSLRVERYQWLEKWPP